MLVGAASAVLHLGRRAAAGADRRLAADRPQDDFDHRIQLRSHDEMAELAEAMNDMTARFQEIRDDLDEQVQERTQASRPQRAAGQRRLSGGRRGARNQQPAGLDRLVRRIARSARCTTSLARRRPTTRPPTSKPRSTSSATTCDGFRTKPSAARESPRSCSTSRGWATCRGTTPTCASWSQGVIEMVRHLGKYRDKHIEFDPAASTSIAAVNAQEIKQVVLNLITNGLDSLDAGGTVLDRARRRAATGPSSSSATTAAA